MHTYSYKKKNRISWCLSLLVKYKWLALVLGLGIYQFSAGLYIFAKAELAQYLIAKAWNKNLSSHQQQAPWPWADTFPVAELIIKDSSWYVLAGASGRNLAFAPTHVSATPLPGKLGNSVIVGHRDTQFNQLKNIQKGDVIEVKTTEGRQPFKVSSLRIAHQSQVEYLYDDEESSNLNYSTKALTLITCYPFDSLVPNPTHRYIVKAVAI
ncbi:class GN sortase [Paraglaciecola aquimarina]|uniref:Class GN sortase n=1 Tax=Paraglaciecola algarum TaxID=3050085 RepID=A0ABS9D3F0_9ALTE|nr:class GN sortase [Paraglaciecola sp. G1-23]MCF2947458.1 class GN sortase [Paraglaciecola sp. G1-23]